MDILLNSLPQEVLGMIFDYLPLEDLLNASLVSKRWMQYIGSCEPFRRKCLLNACQWDWEKKRFPDIERSCRAYENLKIKLFKEKDKSTLSKLLTSKAWRRVHFNVSRILSQKRLVSYVERLEYVRELRMLNVQVGEIKAHEKIALVDLEKLSFSDVAIDTLDTFMAHQPSLKRLSLRFISSDILSRKRSGEVVKDFLKKNSHISELELHEDVTNDLYRDDITQELKLNLRTLSIGLSNNADVDSVRKNLIAFLRSQRALERLELILQQKFIVNHEYDWWREDDRRGSSDLMLLFEAWNDFYSLKELSITFAGNRDEEELAISAYKYLKPNNNVTSLFIRHSNRPQLQSKYVLAVMKLCPNLNYLYLSTLNPTVARGAAYNLKLLRSICYMTEEGGAINEYRALQIAQAEGINRFINFSVALRG